MTNEEDRELEKMLEAEFHDQKLYQSMLEDMLDRSIKDFEEEDFH